MEGCYWENAHRANRIGVIGPDGRYECRGVRAGEYYLVLSDADHVLGITDVFTLADGEHQQVVELYPGTLGHSLQLFHVAASALLREGKVLAGVQNRLAPARDPKAIPLALEVAAIGLQHLVDGLAPVFADLAAHVTVRALHVHDGHRLVAGLRNGIAGHGLGNRSGVHNALLPGGRQRLSRMTETRFTLAQPSSHTCRCAGHRQRKQQWMMLDLVYADNRFCQRFWTAGAPRPRHKYASAASRWYRDISDST